MRLTNIFRASTGRYYNINHTVAQNSEASRWGRVGKIVPLVSTRLSRPRGSRSLRVRSVLNGFVHVTNRLERDYRSLVDRSKRNSTPYCPTPFNTSRLFETSLDGNISGLYALSWRNSMSGFGIKERDVWTDEGKYNLVP